MRVYTHFSGVGACPYYRSRLPVRHCEPWLRERGVSLEGDMKFDADQIYDAAIFSRVFKSEFTDELRRLKDRGTRIYFDCDDDLFNIPAWSPAYAKFQDVLPDFREQLALADRLTVTTPQLAAALGRPEVTDVLPNLVDLGDWRQYLPDQDDSTIRILWAGSSSHTGDIERLTDAVEYLRWDSSVHVTFVGILPRAFSQPLPQNVTYFPSVPLFSYPALIGLIRPHIALLPLVDHPFNHSKSNIKWLEMTLAGAACVCDPVGPYADLPSRGLALGVKSDDWINPVRDLINDRELRHHLWSRSLSELDARWAWHGKGADAWRDWYATQFVAR